MNAPIEESSVVYVGFWHRCAATLVDGLLLFLVTLPPVYLIYGEHYFQSDEWMLGPADLLISWILPFIGTVVFWIRKRATPGKMAINARVVDADTLGTMTVRQAVIRYLGYLVSFVPLLIGFIWIAFDPRKQAWHDKIANTVVIDRNAAR